MAKNKFRQQMVFFDGTKAINAWDADSMVGWTSLSASVIPTEGEYFRSVPWLYRAVKDRSNNVGAMPFAILRGGNEIDSSADYKNALGFFDNPTTVFKKVEMALAMTGRAYLLKEINKSGYIKNIRYLTPTSLTEVYDAAGNVSGYERVVKGIKYTLTPSQVVAIYDPDYMTENGPGVSSAATAALASAGVLFNADKFVSNFFERGAIKATILATQGTQRDEAERLQHWWDDVISGVKNAWSALVLRGEGVKPVVIGEGLESLGNEELTKERRQNIATAMGVPESRMWSAAANYATRVQDDKAYYVGTIIPDCDLISEAFNNQVFTAEHNLKGYQLIFQSENLDVFQTDAASQADALGQLTAAGVPLLMAMDLLGFDLTDEQRAELEELAEEPEPEPQPVPAQLMTPPPAQPEPEEQEEEEEPTPEMRNALSLWQRKAAKRLKESGSAVCEFVSADIPPAEHARITAGLTDCKTTADVKSLFAGEVIQSLPQPDPLAEQIKRAVDWLEGHPV